MTEKTSEKIDRKVKVAKTRRQIKEVKTKLANLTPAAAAEAVSDVVAEQARKQVSGFGDFLREQSVVGVGIGIVFGTQIKVVVDSIMAGFINPITGLLLPGSGGLAKQAFTLTIGDQKAKIEWGSIVYTLLTFVIVAAIIYATYKLLKLDRFKKKG
ncbi:MscL family protein [Candidatus Saccharibacteria bacterium]|nr:MscL family protein [Candidatus Saccharibacteria bacterium]